MQWRHTSSFNQSQLRGFNQRKSVQSPRTLSIDILDGITFPFIFRWSLMCKGNSASILIAFLSNVDLPVTCTSYHMCDITVLHNWYNMSGWRIYLSNTVYLFILTFNAEKGIFLYSRLPKVSSTTFDLNSTKFLRSLRS